MFFLFLTAYRTLDRVRKLWSLLLSLKLSQIIQSTMGQILGVEYSSEGGGENVPGMSPFHELSRDCFFKIITITSPRDALNAASVSKSFEFAVKNDRAWEKFIPPDYSSLIPKPLNFSSKQKVYSYLCDHFLIEDGKKVRKLTEVQFLIGIVLTKVFIFIYNACPIEYF